VKQLPDTSELMRIMQSYGNVEFYTTPGGIEICKVWGFGRRYKATNSGDGDIPDSCADAAYRNLRSRVWYEVTRITDRQ